MKFRKKSFIAKIALGALSLGTLLVSPAQAAQKGISLDFAASYYRSYDHSIGGGAWDDKTINTDIENSLEGSEFVCGDYVSFLTKIALEDIQDLRDLGKMTLELNYEFDGDSTGTSGVGYTEFGEIGINRAPIVDLVAGEDETDSAMVEINALSQESLTTFHNPDPLFSGDNLTGTITVDDLEAGETIILRTDVKISCDPGSSPTGNILAKIMSARLVAANGAPINPITVNIGANTVPLQNPADVTTPILTISKTGLKGTGTCPGTDFTEISPGGTVTFCYVVKNDSLAPIYNLSIITDDNATPSNTLDDFFETLTGLTNLDGDGLLDDLGPGETATAFHVKKYDGQKDTYETNTATVNGYSASTGGSMLSASDITVVYIDPPLPISLSIDKRTNGADGQNILAGTPITWTYDITNTGEETLTSISLADDQEGAITCPMESLSPSASMQCTETGTAAIGSYSNIGTVTGTRESIVETTTASDTSSYFGADPKISIAKSPESQTIKWEGDATFEILVTNTGNITLESVSVTDTLTAGCAKFIGALAPSETSTYSCSYESVTASFINTAVVEAIFESMTVSDFDTASVTYIPPPLPISISINKLTNGADGLNIIKDSFVTWTYDVTNTGQETLTAISVSDDKLLGVSCPKTTLGIGESMQCAETSTAGLGSYSNLATVIGYRGEDTTTATDTSSYFGADPKISILKSPQSQTVVESGTANFEILITNTGNVSLESVTVSDELSPGCAKTIGVLGISETSTYTCMLETVTAGFINTAIVSGIFESTTVNDSDTATVIVDYLPKISVTKSANPTSVPETGGDVLFTFTVTNLGVETFTLTSLSDDKFGNLNGQGSCLIPQSIAASSNYSCGVTKKLGDGTLTPFTNVVTATGQDPESNTATETATAGVTFTDVLPDITLEKMANPTTLMMPGGLVTYTFKITNAGSETVTVSSFSDSRFTLPTQCMDFIGDTITPGAYLTCSSSETLTYTDSLAVVNTATATASDDEGNVDTATATATVYFSWYGRTPGYWKNHTNMWPETFTAGLSVVSVFFPTGDLPSFLKTGGVLDLNKNGGIDTLANALAYKGGTGITGAAQILLRAAVAAVLNEKYYGDGYPGSDTVANLIKLVHDTMLINNRSAYLTLASMLDMWNNGNHSTL